MSQAELCGIAGLNQNRVSILENGYMGPTENELAKLLNALDVGLEEVYPEGTKHPEFIGIHLR